MSRLRVLLVDDHPLARTALRLLLMGVAGVEVIAEVTSRPGILDLIRTRRPDVLITDIALTAMSGLNITAEAKECSPGTRVIVLSMHINEEYVLRALMAGASAYVLKDAVVQELEPAINAIARGEIYISPSIAMRAPTDR